MESLPVYVPIVFVATVFAAIGFLIWSIKQAGFQTTSTKILFTLLPVWIVFQATLGISGFYRDPAVFPPRLAIFGVFPALVLIGSYFVFFRSEMIGRSSLRLLTIIHIVRIPVELVLLWLYYGGQVPQAMTFEGRNFDILSGLLAPLAYLIGFSGGGTRRWVLVVYNILGLLLLFNIVSIAVLSLPSPLQQVAFDQPNRAVLYFPYIWLPTIVVPIVLYAHLASLYILGRNRT